MHAQVQPQTTGIATIKPKRKYTKRKAKLTVVKPTVKKEMPKTARAYLRTLGIAADKEGTAIKELIKMHDALKKESQKPAVTVAPAYAIQWTNVPTPTLWDRFKGWLTK